MPLVVMYKISDTVRLAFVLRRLSNLLRSVGGLSQRMLWVHA
eukprot:COSAG06_NODE_150_length_22019_cov_17.221031_18_plen_42_part_00